MSPLRESLDDYLRVRRALGFKLKGQENDAHSLVRRVVQDQRTAH